MPPLDDHLVFTTIDGWARNDEDDVTAAIDATVYREHNPQSADGIDGVRAYLRARAVRDNTRRTVRVLRDGPLAVAQYDGSASEQATSFDVFRFDRDALIEHWSFWSPAAPPNASGHTQLDGPTNPDTSVSTEDTRALVTRYYNTVHIGGHHDQARNYFDADYCVRHEPGVTDGVTAFLADLAVLTRDRTIEHVELLAAQHDLVFLVARGTHQGRPCNYVDLYRVAAGAIVEHWGFFQEEPPLAEHQHSNGVL